MSLSSAYLIRLSPQVFDREAIGLDVVRHSLNAKLGGQILAVAARSDVAYRRLYPARNSLMIRGEKIWL